VTVDVARTCVWCEERWVLSLPDKEYFAWVGGALAQDVWPDLAPAEREAIISGTHPECWDKLIGEDK
jgi:hypothetical protein